MPSVRPNNSPASRSTSSTPVYPLYVSVTIVLYRFECLVMLAHTVSCHACSYCEAWNTVEQFTSKMVPHRGAVSQNQPRIQKPIASGFRIVRLDDRKTLKLRELVDKMADNVERAADRHGRDGVGRQHGQGRREERRRVERAASGAAGARCSTPGGSSPHRRSRRPGPRGESGRSRPSQTRPA